MRSTIEVDGVIVRRVSSELVVVREPLLPARRDGVDALVGERGEAPRRRRPRPGCGDEVGLRGRRAVGEAEPVAVALARREAVGEGVDEELLAAADRAVVLRHPGHQPAHVHRQRGAEAAVAAQVDHHGAGRRRGQLAGERHLALRVGAVGQVPADDGDRRLRRRGARGERPRRRGQARRREHAGAAAQRAAPAHRVAAQEGGQPVVLLGHGHAVGQLGGDTDVRCLAAGSPGHGRQSRPRRRAGPHRVVDAE